MPTDEFYGDETILIPTERRSRFLSFEGPDIYWTIGVGLVSALICLQIGVGFGTVALLGFVGLWIFSMMTPPSEKNRFNDRLFMIPFWWIREWQLMRKNGVIWKADKKAANSDSLDEELTVETVKKGRRRRAEKSPDVKPFPFEATAYVDPESKENIGLIYHQGKQTLSMVFTAPGSSIGSRSRIDQYQTIQQIAAILKTATLSAGMKGIGIGIGMNSRPQDPWKAARMMLESASVRKLAPSALANGTPEEEYSSSDKINIALNQLQAELPFTTVQSYKPSMMIVATMQAPNVSRKKNPQNGITQKEFRRLPIIRLRDLMLPKLRRVIGDSIEVLDLAGVERYLRTARDAATLSDFYDEYQERWVDEKIVEEAHRQGNETIQLVEPAYDRYLPSKNITVGKDYANIDGTWFSVLDMTTSPASHITAADGPAFYDAMTPWMSMAVVGKAVNSRVEYEVSNSAGRTGRDALEFLGYSGGGARAARKEQERSERSAQLDNAGITMDYVIRFATLAPTRELLELETDEETTRLAGLGLGPVRVNNRAQQLRKLLTTLTLIDCE